MKKGVYETTYGNAAYVAGPKAKLAYDLDMAEPIDMRLVTSTLLRKAEPEDSPRYRYMNW